MTATVFSATTKVMRFDVLTLFPDMFQGPLSVSILKRAQDQGALSVHIHNIRDVATDAHKTVDDTPYGGGAGMVLKIDVLHKALQKLEDDPEIAKIPYEKRRILLLGAAGKRFTQPQARYAAKQYEQITLICGHYEGVDERIRKFIDGELSIGDYVLTGGELPALVVIDTITRLLPDVIHEDSPEEESFSLKDSTGKPLLEYPHYTRPLDFQGMVVPDILLSGNHAAIAAWRLEEARKRTAEQSTDDTL